MRNSVFTKLVITSYVDLQLKYWTTKHTVQQTQKLITYTVVTNGTSERINRSPNYTDHGHTISRHNIQNSSLY